MRKFYLTTFFIFITAAQAHCLTFGAYKPESEYGLLDGFKFQVFDRHKGEKIIQLKSDTPEEKAAKDKNTEKDKEEKQDDYQMYKFMLDDTIPL